MDIYKHFTYNPRTTTIDYLIKEAQKDSEEWCFERCQPITEYEWVAIFRKWVSD